MEGFEKSNARAWWSRVGGVEIEDRKGGLILDKLRKARNMVEKQKGKNLEFFFFFSPKDK